MNYEELLKKAKETYKSEDTPHVVKAWLLANIIYPVESEDERIRKGIIRNLQYLMDRSEGFVKEDLQERIAWLEKQDKKISADKVIEWLNHHELSRDDVVTSVIPDDSPTSVPHRVKWLSDEFIKQFKKDFGI